MLNLACLLPMDWSPDTFLPLTLLSCLNTVFIFVPMLAQICCSISWQAMSSFRLQNNSGLTLFLPLHSPNQSHALASCYITAESPERGERSGQNKNTSPAGCERKSSTEEIVSWKVHIDRGHGYHEVIQGESGLASKIWDPTKSLVRFRVWVSQRRLTRNIGPS